MVKHTTRDSLCSQVPPSDHKPIYSCVNLNTITSALFISDLAFIVLIAELPKHSINIKTMI